jgi:hypothetical protein
VRSIYVGRGETAALVAELDQAERARRQAKQSERLAERTRIAALAADPPALTVFLAYVRDQVAEVLRAAGYHQHKRQWRRKRDEMSPKRRESAALMTVQTADEWFKETIRVAMQRDALPAIRHEYAKLLDLYPQVVPEYGDLATMAQEDLRDRFLKQPAVSMAVARQADALCAQLGREEATPIEQLLIGVVVLTWHDYHTGVLLAMANNTSGSAALEQWETWERIIASKEARYLKAIEALARVRRLLKLAAPQVNINMPGGQQVNVNGTVETNGTQ